MTLPIGLAVSLIVTPLAIVVARHIDLLDRPGPLKIHQQPVPYLGGVGILAACAAGLAPDRSHLIVPLLLAPRSPSSSAPSTTPSRCRRSDASPPRPSPGCSWH